MSYPLFLTLFIIANVVFLVFFNNVKIFLNIYDVPNDRKIHKNKVACIGGFLILFSVFFLLFFFKNYLFDAKNFFLNSRHFFSFYLSSMMIFLLGLLDDKIDISALKKTFLLVFLISISVTLDNTFIIKSLNFSFYTPPIILTESFSIFFTIFCIFSFLNAFNMFDGIDLQSGLYSLLIFLVFLFKTNYVLIFLPIILSILFFLYLNFRKLIFLGNNGSYLLGYLISWFSIKLYNYNIIQSADYIFLLMLIPGLDLIRLTIERLINNKNPLEADNNHIHHKLSKRFNQEKAKIITFLMILTPIFIETLTSTLTAIIIGTTSYIFFIFFVVRKN